MIWQVTVPSFVLSLSKHERWNAICAKHIRSPFDGLRACPVLDTGANGWWCTLIPSQTPRRRELFVSGAAQGDLCKTRACSRIDPLSLRRPLRNPCGSEAVPSPSTGEGEGESSHPAHYHRFGTVTQRTTASRQPNDRFAV